MFKKILILIISVFLSTSTFPQELTDSEGLIVLKKLAQKYNGNQIVELENGITLKADMVAEEDGCLFIAFKGKYSKKGNKMKRKVVLHGPSTLIISLPISWTKKYNVQKGDELDVVEKNNQLVVSTDGVVALGSTVINAEKIDRTGLRAMIMSAYRKGFDTIEIRYNKPTTYHCRLEKEVEVDSVVEDEIK